MVIQLYHMDFSPPSRSVHMTLKALGVKHEVNRLDMFNGEHKKPVYLAINPRGKVPAIVDGKLKLSESRAICQYLCNKYAKGDKQSLYPSDPKQRAVVDMELYVSEIAFDALIGLNPPAMFLRGEKPSAEKVTAAKECATIINNRLEGKKYLAGNNLTIADFCSYTTVVMLEVLIGDLGEVPNVKAWMGRLKALSYDNEVNAKPMEQIAGMLKEKMKPKRETKF